MSLPSFFSVRWNCPHVLGMLILMIFLLAALGAEVSHAASNAYFDIEPTFVPSREMRPRAHFLYESGPGTLIRDSIHVKNNGTVRGTVTIYPVDATTSQGSGEAFLTRHDRQSDVGTWMTLSSQQVTLNAGQSQDIPFSVTIPVHARPGQHFGGLVAEEPGQPSSQGAIPAVVRLHTREVIEVRINLPGAVVEKLRTTGITYDNASASAYQRLLVALENRGTQVLHPSGSVRVTNAAGQQFQIVPMKLHAILPQTSIDYPVYMHHTALNPGTYTATLSLQYEHNHKLNYNTRFVVPLTQLQHNFAVPRVVADFVTPNESFFSALTPWHYVIGLGVVWCVLSTLFFWSRKLYTSGVNWRGKGQGRKPKM